MLNLKRATYQGDTCYTWRDPNGKLWRVYRSFGFGLWRFIREDHNGSSIGYPTMHDAVAALERAFA